MNNINYMLVSEGAILRDYITPEYINEEHKSLVDIADFFYNANLGAEYLKPEAKELYNRYGKEFWEIVLKDMSAIDSQMTGDREKADLILDYNDQLLQARQ